MSCVKLVAHRIGAKDGRERGAGLENLHRRQSAGISEHDAGSGFKLEDEPREPRKLFLAGTDDPVTCHSKVHVQHGPVIEHRELMLSPTLDAGDRPSGEALQARLAQIPPNVRMEDLRANDARARRRTSKGTRGMLDFRKLWHERQRTLAAARAQACAIDSAAWTRRV